MLFIYFFSKCYIKVFFYLIFFLLRGVQVYFDFILVVGGKLFVLNFQVVNFDVTNLCAITQPANFQ